MLSVDKGLHFFLNTLNSRRRRSSSHGSALIKRPNLAYLHQRRRSSPGQLSSNVLSRFRHRIERQSKKDKVFCLIIIDFLFIIPRLGF